MKPRKRTHRGEDMPTQLWSEHEARNGKLHIPLTRQPWSQLLGGQIYGIVFKEQDKCTIQRIQLIPLLTDKINSNLIENGITAFPIREVGGSILGVGFRPKANRAEDKAAAKGASSTTVSVSVCNAM